MERSARVILLCFCALALAGVPYAEAGGFNIVDQGTEAMGRAGAYTATADDGSAIYFNPAGLTEQKEGLIQNDLIVTYRYSKYEPTSGTADHMYRVTAHPSLFSVADTKNSRYKFGVGLFSPFGSITDWDEHGPLRYVATYSEMKLTALNPTVSVEIIPELSFGLGFDIYESKVVSRKKVDFGALIGQSGLWDGDYRLKSEKTHAYGFNLGLLYKINQKNRVGFAYRSRFSMNYHGGAEIFNVPFFVPGTPSMKSAAEATYNFPDEYMFGYAHKFTKKLEAEFDLQWTNWSRFNSVNITFDQRPSWNTFIPKNWNDGFIYKSGLEYALTDTISLRGGYAYSTSPVPSATFDPANPDARRNTFYLGGGYKKGRLTANIAFTLTIFHKRFVDNNVGASSGTSIDGDYETVIPQVAFGGSWSF